VKSDRVLRKYYRLINHKFFNDQLPDNVCCRYVTDEDEEAESGCERRYYGWCEPTFGKHKFVIVISRVKNPGWPAKLSTLCHEMCHIFTDLKDDHGPAFEAARQMIADRGVFKKNAVLRGLTLF
jgi:hypothetical protein